MVGMRVGASKVAGGILDTRLADASLEGVGIVLWGANPLGGVKIGSAEPFAPKEQASIESAMTSPAIVGRVF